MKNLEEKKYILNSNSGFTLIEVLVAITILSMLMATMYSIVNDSTETKDRITSEDREVLQIVTALERIEMDISQIYTPLYYSAKYSEKKNLDQDYDEDLEPQEDRENEEDSIKDPRKIFSPTERFPIITEGANIAPIIQNEAKTELVFLSTSNRRILEDSKQSRYTWVSYELRSMTDTTTDRKGGYELTRATESENIYQSDFNWDSIKKHILLKNIKSFKFQFWNTETKKFVDSLTDLGKNNATPRLFKVSLVWINKDNNEVVIERSFRPLYPFFDTEKAEKDKYQDSKSSSDKLESNDDK